MFVLKGEKEKIAEQIDTYNNFRDKVVNPSEFEETAEQLNTVSDRRMTIIHVQSPSKNFTYNTWYFDRFVLYSFK